MNQPNLLLKVNKKHLIINHFLIAQIEAEGKEVRKVIKDSKILMATFVNPIDRLFRKGILTRQEYFAGRKYCNDYNLANLSNHSRPFYDGSAPSKSKVAFLVPFTKSQLEASKSIHEAQKAIYALNAEQKRTRKLPEILQLVFEQEKSFNCVEKMLGMNHSVLEARVKLICEALLEL